MSIEKGMDSKELEEELERVMKNMLEDMSPKAATLLTSIDIKPHKIQVRYINQDGKKCVSKLNTTPQDFLIG